MPIISNNSDFLFLFEAIQCNPNGDPDQENKPRMDYDTDTNLVTDTRLKRYIRDYLSLTDNFVFVNMEGDQKVAMDSKLKIVLERLFEDEEALEAIFLENPSMKNIFSELRVKSKTVSDLVNLFVNKKPASTELNRYLLSQLIKEQFTDIRMFGCAFAVDGFTKPYTGAIQINWGYSLNKVQLMESSSIVTIMEDDSSTFGKDYRVHYSLLAFNGTINKFAARTTGLTEADRSLFRDAIWESIPALPTRTKLNQYPRVYLEIVYNEGFNNGHFGDLRQHITLNSKVKDEKTIRSANDYMLDFSALETFVNENKGEGKPIKEVYLKTASGILLNI